MLTNYYSIYDLLFFIVLTEYYIQSSDRILLYARDTIHIYKLYIYRLYIYKLYIYKLYIYIQNIYIYYMYMYINCIYIQ